MEIPSSEPTLAPPRIIEALHRPFRRLNSDFVVLDCAEIANCVYGTFCAVALAYILQDDLDPDSVCPGDMRGKCWSMIGAFGINACLGVAYIPCAAAALERWSAWALARLPQRRVSFRAETAKALTALAAGAASSAYSVSVSTTFTYVLAEVEWEVSSQWATPDVTGPSAPRARKRGGAASFQPPTGAHPRRRRPPGGGRGRRLDENDDAPPTGLLFRLFCVRFLLCASVLVGAYATMATATRRAETAKGPNAARVWALLRGSLHYVSALAISTVLTSLLFLPFDASPALGTVTAARFAAALFKAGAFFLGARAVARRLPQDQDAESAVPALARKTAAVVACLGVFDAVDFFITAQLDLDADQEILAFWIYAVAVAAAALAHRERKRRRTRRARTSEDLRRANDAVFDEVYEAWTVAFAFWTPYEDTLIRVYDSVDADHVGLKLLWQLALVVLVLTCCGLLNALGALCFPKRPRRDSAEPPSGYVHLQDADFSLATSPPPSDDGSEGRPSLDAGPVPVLTTV